MIRTYSQMHCTDEYSQHSSIIWPVWQNGWVFIYELSGCGFESSCSHLNFRFCTCFEQRVPWHSGNYRVSIPSETRMWHDKNIQSVKDCLHTAGMFKLSSRRWSWWNNGKLQSYQSAERGLCQRYQQLS